ncbi:hypothetical protein FXO38_15984 [Capsicum annuum]|uniref:uncharacterized protein LOC107876710 n=1 Tax=Capsicum annuum TaxID=4072 RepID=UPI0007BEC121|nr:uncharacterized protein LOC107876710 [Capsicum annuum]KAF3652640.1 hypothetical protein FXO38_15984 [Capsicum annuum]KAF3654538.1 hypothetical protein FXO37_16436 [Capsicum annuum]
MAKEFWFLAGPTSPDKIRITMYTKWKSPAQANYMLNTDCASEISSIIQHQLGLGGVFRNYKGEWVLGFHGTCAATDVLEGETHALLLGLQLAYQNNLYPLEIGIDSQQLVRLLDSNTYPNTTLISDSTLISDCRYLLCALDNPQLHHFFREQNRLAE